MNDSIPVFLLILLVLWKLRGKAILRLRQRRYFSSIPGPKRASWATGNLKQLFDPDGLSFHHELFKNYGKVMKVHGLFGGLSLYVSDPQSLRSIVQMDQDEFEETEVFLITNKVIFGDGLLSVSGEEHKRQRKVLNPAFSPTNIKRLSPVLTRIAREVRAQFMHELRQQQQPSDSRAAAIDMYEWFSRSALESIGRAGLGYSFGALESEDHPYTSAIKNLIPTLFKVNVLRQAAPFFNSLGTTRIRRWLAAHSPVKAVRELKDMTDVMYETSKAVLENASQGIRGLDTKEPKNIIDLLLEENEKLSKYVQLTHEQLLGQISTMTFGAMDTTASAASRVVEMLALHPDIQERLRDEIFQTGLQFEHEVSYETITGLPLLDAVVKETLRLYPPTNFLLRTARKDVVLPYRSRARNNTVLVPKGTMILIGLGAVNRSTELWGDDAEQWRPERWLAPLPDALKEAKLPGVYSSMMTFYGGGRACIGVTFANLQIRILIAVLLASFIFYPAPDAHIKWNLGLIMSPAVRDADAKYSPGLPLIVRAL